MNISASSLGKSNDRQKNYIHITLIPFRFCIEAKHFVLQLINPKVMVKIKKKSTLILHSNRRFLGHFPQQWLLRGILKMVLHL